MAKGAAGKARPATKSEVFAGLAEKTGLNKKQIQSVFDALIETVRDELGKKGPGVFTLPGLLKLRAVRKPATKERQGINPFTKEPITIPAKPARNMVRARALKGLNEMIA